jgi:hypothetical protein
LRAVVEWTVDVGRDDPLVIRGYGSGVFSTGTYGFVTSYNDVDEDGFTLPDRVFLKKIPFLQKKEKKVRLNLTCPTPQAAKGKGQMCISINTRMLGALTPHPYVILTTFLVFGIKFVYNTCDIDLSHRCWC